MKYFFVLGNHPTLSVAEISAFFGLDEIRKDRKGYFANQDIFILETDKAIDASRTIKRMGGIIKIGKIENECPFSCGQEQLSEKIIDVIEKRKDQLNQGGEEETAETSKVFRFGISAYGKDDFDRKELAMGIKKELKASGIKNKWATSREKNLSSVAVEKNGLISKGAEIVLAGNKEKNRLLIGRTLAVQPFEELSARDYGRPARDDRSGMIPPKLAQIMINLAGLDEERHSVKILDPFCGSGTILTEAMLMGYKNMAGSDSSAKAVGDTEKNIQWIADRYDLENVNCQLQCKDAEKISSVFKAGSFDAIITEPYLGPQRGKYDAKKIVREMDLLYSKAISEFAKVLKPGGKIVMIWPIFNSFQRSFKLHPDIFGFEIKKILPAQLEKSVFSKISSRGTIVYARKGQRVWREIVVLEK